MSTLATLKQRTRPYHDALEDHLRIETRCGSPAAYRELLCCFYGFYLPIEESLARLPDLAAAGVDLGRRRKSHMLARDLGALDLPDDQLAALPCCQDLPRLTGAAAGLGCLYVLEGATLGGQVIARQVTQQLALPADGGRAFFSSYGPQVGPMWRAFGAALTAYVTTPDREAEAVAAACATFESFQRWTQRTLL